MIPLERPRRLLALGATCLVLAAAAPAHAQTGVPCFPPVNGKEPNYVIGYGSLMQTRSKEQTWGDTGPNLPIILRGFERRWNARGRNPGVNTTYVGVARVAGARMAASLFRVLDPTAFRSGDRRENVYCRVAVVPSEVEMLDGTDTPRRGKIWIYLPQKASDDPPAADYPIIQTYVDLILSGCIELSRLVVDRERDFVADCVTTTKGWSVYWVNDRPNPRRPDNGPLVRRIDGLLKRLLPKEFAAIRIE